MSATANTLSTLNGLFKEIYANKLEQLIPDGVKLYKQIPFSSRDKQIGNNYNQPVILGAEHGITYGGPDDDAFNLNPPVAGQIKNAQVRGNPKVMRSLLGYTSASRAAGGSPKAFEDATKFLVANMLRSMHKRLEIELIYGQMGLGTVASTSANDVVITDAEWAPGIWAGAEKMPIEFRTSAGVLVGSANITRVNLSTKTLTVDALPGAVAASDVIWFKGAYGNEFAGIHKILANTGSLFGIDAAEFSLWAGNSYPSGGVLSLEKVELAIARAVEKGLEGDVICIVNPSVFGVLVADEAALRQYDASYKGNQAENGFSSLKFHALNGLVTIEPSIHCKQGYAYLVEIKEFVRIGSSDVTFKRPAAEGEFFRDLENAAAYEMRLWTDQALFTPYPGHNVVITGVTLS